MSQQQQQQQHQDGGELKRVDSFQWPSGHVGHLSEGQTEALQRFKKLCEEKGYYAAGDDTNAPTHDDETLLRYLRARKFLAKEAFVQLKETEDWRKENELDALYETIDVHEYEHTRRLYPQWTGRRDKRGIPFYVFEVAHVDPKAVSAQDHSKHDKSLSTSGKTPHRMLRLFALYENLCRFVLPLCSAIPDRPHSETPISQSNNIVDISKVSFAKFWSLRNHMSDASKLATAHYPETLDRIFVVGAPSFFPMVWDFAKRWFDPITVSKIFILPEKNIAATLAKYVDMDNIPKKYGGNLAWEFGDMPYLEPGIADALRWNEQIEENGHRTLPIGPIRWQYDEKGDLVATAIGTEHGKRRKQIIAGLHPEAGVARLALSPGWADKAMTHVATAATAAAAAPAAKPTPSESSTGVEASGVPRGTAGAGDTSSHHDADLTAGNSADAAMAATSGAGTSTVPDKDNATSQGANDARTGTSSTRFEQQSSTHAADQLAHGTPEVKLDGQGERQGIMEPQTVGQAAKEHPIPATTAEENAGSAQPGLMEKAQQVAGQAYETAAQIPQQVLSAVGMGAGGKGKEEEEEEGEDGKGVVGSAGGKKGDSDVDGLESKHVEEFLRQKTMSQPQPPGR